MGAARFDVESCVVAGRSLSGQGTAVGVSTVA